MILNLTEENEKKAFEIRKQLGEIELLNQLSEECAELIQAAQKLRRVRVGKTPVTEKDAIENIVEEMADVVLLISMISDSGIVNKNQLYDIANYKTNRWYNRIFCSNLEREL